MFTYACSFLSMVTIALLYRKYSVDKHISRSHFRSSWDHHVTSPQNSSRFRRANRSGASNTDGSNIASAASSNFGTAILAFSNSHHDHTTKPLFLGQIIPKQISNNDSRKSNGLGLTNSSRESLTHTDLWILPKLQNVCEKEQWQGNNRDGVILINRGHITF